MFAVKLSPYRTPVERRHRRFALVLPVLLEFSRNGKVHNSEALSENVSILGLLAKTRASIPLRTAVSLTIEIKAAAGRCIRLLAEGEIVRVEAVREGGYAIAVECRRPIAEIDDRFSDHLQIA